MQMVACALGRVEQCGVSGCVCEKCFWQCADGAEREREPLFVKLARQVWDCHHECRYHCMLSRELERLRLSQGPLKYHGKLPFRLGLASKSLEMSKLGSEDGSPWLFTELHRESSTSDNSYQLYEQFSFSYPALLQPLLHERDTYLSLSLKRSKAVNNSKQVVGVIGKGHMNGVVYALMSDQGNLRFWDLAEKAPGDGGSRVWVEYLMRSLVKDTIIGILLWALYELVKGRL